jgi:hypothetical protein
LVNRAQLRPELAAPGVAAAVPQAEPTPVVTELPFEPKPGGPQADVNLAEPEAIELEPALAAATVPPASSKKIQSIQSEPSNEEERSFPL